MRNSKVRQRIAAGKLKLRIRDLRNLGVKSEQVLGALGIYTADALRHQGAVRVYAELKRSGAAPSLNLLWALAGALEPWPEGTHWREIARGDTRLSLLLAVEDLEASAAAARGKHVSKATSAGVIAAGKASAKKAGGKSAGKSGTKPGA